jgi:hypothetical protein
VGVTPTTVGGRRLFICLGENLAAAACLCRSLRTWTAESTAPWPKSHVQAGVSRSLPVPCIARVMEGGQSLWSGVAGSLLVPRRARAQRETRVFGLTLSPDWSLQSLLVPHRARSRRETRVFGLETLSPVQSLCTFQYLAERARRETRVSGPDTLSPGWSLR